MSGRVPAGGHPVFKTVLGHFFNEASSGPPLGAADVKMLERMRPKTDGTGHGIVLFSFNGQAHFQVPKKKNWSRFRSLQSTIALPPETVHPRVAALMQGQEGTEAVIAATRNIFADNVNSLLPAQASDDRP